MKKIFLPLTLTALVALTACGDNSNKPQAQNSPANNSTANNTAQTNTAENSGDQSGEKAAETDNSLTKDWVAYTSKDGSYSAKFPAKPNEQTQTAQSSAGPIEFTLVSHADNSEQRAFMTSTSNIPLPEGASKKDFNLKRGLDGARDNAAKNAGAKVVQEREITLNNNPGREILMHKDEGNLDIKLRIYVDTDSLKLYQALVVAGKGNINKPETDAFLDSMAITQ